MINGVKTDNTGRLAAILVKYGAERHYLKVDHIEGIKRNQKETDHNYYFGDVLVPRC